jgi:hypothetical protein
LRYFPLYTPPERGKFFLRLIFSLESVSHSVEGARPLCLPVQRPGMTRKHPAISGMTGKI